MSQIQWPARSPFGPASGSRLHLSVNTVTGASVVVVVNASSVVISVVVAGIVVVVIPVVVVSMNGSQRAPAGLLLHEHAFLLQLHLKN